MPSSNASFINVTPYRDANDLAANLATLFAGGIRLDAFDTSSIDSRYARLAAVNVFTAEQQISGAKLLVSGVVSGNSIQVTHGVTSGGEGNAAARIESTNAAGGLVVKRNVTSGAGDHLVVISENVSAYNGLRINYGGSASALYVGQTGTGTYAIETAGKGIYVAAGGIVVAAGGLTVSAGGATISAGGLTVTTGASSFGGAVTITAGGLNVTTGGCSVTGGLTVTSAGAAVTGASSFSSTLGVTGLLTASGGISVSGNVSGVTTLTATTGNITTVNATNLTVSGSTISVNGFTFQTAQVNYDYLGAPTTKRFLVV